MHITGTHFNYYQICHRKLWLFANGIQMEQTNETVSDGKLLHETSYPDRAEKYREVETEGIKIDFFDPKENVIHEIKRSDKMEDAHFWQVKYYIYKLHKAGFKNVTGLLEYPKLRKTDKVELSEEDLLKIMDMEKEIKNIIAQQETPPRLTKKSFCRKCAYFDFCWSEEGGED